MAIRHGSSCLIVCLLVVKGKRDDLDTDGSEKVLVSRVSPALRKCQVLTPRACTDLKIFKSIMTEKLTSPPPSIGHINNL